MEKAFTETDIATVQDFVNENIIEPNKSMVAKDMYLALKDRLNNKDMIQSAFQLAIGSAVKSGAIKGIEGRKRVGFIRAGTAKVSRPVVVREKLDDNNTIEKPSKKSEQNEKDMKELVRSISKPEITGNWVKPQHARNLWIKDSHYKVFRSFQDILLLIQSINGQEDNEGDVVFDGKKYKCDNDIFRKLLINFFNAASIDVSEPVLNDESGIPVELRI